VDRGRAADDFAAIRARVEELRRDRVHVTAVGKPINKQPLGLYELRPEEPAMRVPLPNRS
jgi:hypothetical protein